MAPALVSPSIIGTSTIWCLFRSASRKVERTKFIHHRRLEGLIKLSAFGVELRLLSRECDPLSIVGSREAATGCRPERIDFGTVWCSVERNSVVFAASILVIAIEAE